MASQYNNQQGNRQANVSPAALKARLDEARPKLAQVGDAALIAKVVDCAIRAFSNDQRLQRCTLDSWEAAVYSLVSQQLDPDPTLSLVAFTPRWDSRANETRCRLSYGYRGLLVLARRSESIVQIYAQVVCANDTLVPEGGTEPKLVHKIAFPDRGEPTGAYSVAWVRDCPVPTFELMSKEEIEKCRAKSERQNAGPWAEWWGEMAKKTVLRRHCKYLPVGSAALTAAQADEETELPDDDAVAPAGPADPPAPAPAAAPPAKPAAQPTPAPHAPAQPKGEASSPDLPALKERARELVRTLRSTIPDGGIERAMQRVNLKDLRSLASANAVAVEAFIASCEQELECPI